MIVDEKLIDRRIKSWLERAKLSGLSGDTTALSGLILMLNEKRRKYVDRFGVPPKLASFGDEDHGHDEYGYDVLLDRLKAAYQDLVNGRGW